MQAQHIVAPFTWDDAYEMLSFTIDTLSVHSAVFSGCDVRAYMTTGTGAPMMLGGVPSVHRVGRRLGHTIRCNPSCWWDSGRSLP